MNCKHRIAVIAVHGVGDHQPRSSATHAADLLHGKGDGYEWLGQSVVRIPVKAVSTDVKDHRTPERKKTEAATYVSKAMKQALQRKPQPELLAKAMPEGIPEVLEKRKTGREIPLEVQEMGERLLHYKPRVTDVADVIYETPRIELLRRTNGCECHVFEMFWGDLSRLQTMVIGTVVAFYQLLFFLCDRGARTIHYARAKYAKDKRWWSVFDWVHFIAHLILVLGIPILNLALFGLAIAAVVSGYSEKMNMPGTVVALILGTVLSGGLAALFVIREQRVPARFWSWTFFVVSLAFLLPLALTHLVDLKRWVPMMTWLIIAFVIFGLMTIYEERYKDHARICTIPILSFVTIAFAWELYGLGWPSGWSQLFKAGSETMRQAITYVHWPLWIGFAFFSLVCWLVAEGAVRLSGLSDEDKDHARRVAFTAKISLAIPGALVLIVDLGLWQLLVRGFDKLPGDLIEKGQKEEALQVFMSSVPVGTAWSLILFLGAVLFAGWLILPAALAEWRPPNDARAGWRPPNDAPWFGVILSAGLRKLRWSAWTLQLLITIGLLSSVALWWPPTFNESHLEDGLALLAVSSALFVLFALRGAGKAIRNILDIALDVANWLRFDPPERTPCARICARYASLLRHICNWTDPESGARYNAVIILAHSQGTVITADLFRFLTHSSEPGLGRIFEGEAESQLPVYLFTMGCPLRQLYSLRFPDEYAWARDAAGWDAATRPNPDDLHVELWSNFYRSGDYVGRALWHPDPDRSGADAEAWDSQKRKRGKRHERCIGAGAHTHYWDETAPEIAEELDYLIETACNR